MSSSAPPAVRICSVASSVSERSWSGVEAMELGTDVSAVTLCLSNNRFVVCESVSRDEA